MIIKQLNAITIDRIVEHDKLMQITEIDQYVQEQRDFADSIIANAKNQVAEEVEAAKIAAITQLQQDNQQLLAASEAKLEQVLADVHTNLYSIILHTLTKFGALEINPAMIKELLSSELSKFSSLGELRIKAHPETLEILTQGLSIAKDKLILEADSSLDKEICICETNLWVMNLAVNEVKQRFLTFLQADAHQQNDSTDPI